MEDKAQIRMWEGIKDISLLGVFIFSGFTFRSLYRYIFFSDFLNPAVVSHKNCSFSHKEVMIKGKIARTTDNKPVFLQITNQKTYLFSETETEALTQVNSN